MTKRKNPYWTVRVTRQPDGELVTRTISGDYPLAYRFIGGSREDHSGIVRNGVKATLNSLEKYLIEHGGQFLSRPSVTIKFRVKRPKYG